MRRRTIPTPAGLVAVALAVALVAGCGGRGKKSASTTTEAATTTSATPTVDRKVAALVPAAVKSKGTLTVASFAHYAPNEFFGSDGKTIQGMDPDLAKALAGLMGLKVRVVNAPFSTIIPGVSSGKYDLGMSSITDTKQRQKSVDFVTYFKAGTSFYTNTTGGQVIHGALADLCGNSVAVARGTTQQRDATAQSASCKAGRKPGVKVFVYPNLTAASLGVSRGRGRIGMADSPVAAYLVVKSASGHFKLTGTPYNVAPYGIAIPKGNGMAKPILAGLKVLMADRSYDTILTRWYVLSGGIKNPRINGATS
ncbi:MAG: ABC transporter substrate-binding protein [Gaiellaceae bacterium]